ncbi:MAG: translation elongation factor Ts [Bacteroidia bacterium]|nr:translation elongation factor Ts [Bacteroidia bacterium]
MAQITASDVAKLRNITGAGMMDCKNALIESDGNYETAVEIIRKKGKAVAIKRADREASEGVVLATTTADGKRGAMVVLNCETDFVAKNEKFIEFARRILAIAIEKNPENLDALKNLKMDGRTVAEIVTEQIGIIGEKLDLPHYDKIEAGSVIAYIHPGNKLAALVGLNKSADDQQVGKDMAMQVAAMNPVAVDISDVPKSVVDKEIEIGIEQARTEGKPENMLEKIGQGKLQKFYKESTLLNQEFIKDSKLTVKQYLHGVDKELTVTGFKRYTLNI